MIVATVLVQPNLARACAVCFGGENDDWTGGFLLGTIVMLALPPAIVGFAGFAIYRAMKRQEALVRERDAQSVPVSGGAPKRVTT